VTLLCLLPHLALAEVAFDDPERADLATTRWAADPHVHLASPAICELVGECLESNNPPAVYGADAIEALDEAGVVKGVVFSSGYLYGLEFLALDPRTVARQTRRENEFTAAEVAKYPSRLVGFLSVDPLEESAVEEIGHWTGSRELVGLKIHFAASGVDLGNETHRARAAAVLREAAARDLPVVVHIGGGTFDADDAETFIRTILPAAGDSPVQIAHAGGGYPFADGRHVGVLEAFADHAAADDPRLRRVLFDLAYVPAPEEDAATVSALVHAMRRIGLERFLFGSDFNVLTPVDEIAALERLGLTAEEQAVVRRNCAPWVCKELEGRFTASGE
jgi:predicted TIM-barrel fold metal-dependent hydrolase